jgi:DNA replication protein DnaC
MIEQSVEKLNTMKLYGMVQAIKEQEGMPDIKKLTFEERLSLLIDHEYDYKENKKLSRLLKQATFRIKEACIENIDYRGNRNIDKKFVMELATCTWIRNHLNILISGNAGLGKTYLSCALANNACRRGFSSKYYRFPRLFEELALSHGDGSHIKFLDRLTKFDLLIIDDFGLSPLTEDQKKDLLEIVEDRYDCRSTIITSQYPIDKWYEAIGDPTVADAILERVVHNSYKINLKGKYSLRKEKQEKVKNGE